MRRRLAAWIFGVGGLACLAFGTLAVTAPSTPAQRAADPAHGRALYAAGCASCHGLDARGIAGQGPSLRGVGARSADFYLRTGRMPLAHPDDAPIRAHSVYSRADQLDMTAYIARFGGPPIPRVDPGRGSLVQGKQLFTENCAGCHQVVGQGGIVTPSAIAPSLENDVEPIDVAEAVRIGPYVMPPFGERQLSDADVDDLARYVEHIQDLPNDGGWGIGNLGPIPEGLILWFLGISALLITARLVGERTTR